MNLIAAVDRNWAIGNKGELLAHLSGDMKFFRSKTVNNIVVLGRKTLTTFPGGKPLKDRHNIVLTMNRDFNGQGADVAHSLDELFEMLKKYKTDDIYVIGGESIYSQLIDYCDTAYITKFDKEFEADVYIENLDKSGNWMIVDEEKGIQYRFFTYKNQNFLA